MSMKQIQIAAQIPAHLEDFYKRLFPNMRAASYSVISGFPKVFYRSLDEIHEVFTNKEIEEIVSAIEWMMGSGYDLTGVSVLEVCPDHLREKVQELTVFQRICIELLGFRRTSRKPYVSEGIDSILTTPLVEQSVRDFLAESFPSIFLGTSFLLEKFPQWFRPAVDLAPAKKMIIAKAMEDIESFSPSVLGDILDEALFRACETRVLGPKDKNGIGELLRLSFFQKTCLALECSANFKRNKVVSPKMTKKLASFYTETFNGKASSGVLYAAEFFRAIFPSLVNDTIIEFSRQELQVVKFAMEYHGRPEGLMAGVTIVPAIKSWALSTQEVPVEIDLGALCDKIRDLSLLKRACLEFWGFYQGD